MKDVASQLIDKGSVEHAQLGLYAQAVDADVARLFHLPARSGLLPVGTYLRAVTALGLGSLRAAPLAIGILYCYQLGMELLLALSGDGSSPASRNAGPAATAPSALLTASWLP